MLLVDYRTAKLYNILMRIIYYRDKMALDVEVLKLDKMVMQVCKRKETKFQTAWVDNRKYYDIIRHSWNIDLFGIAMNVTCFLKLGTVAVWKTALNRRGYHA